MKIIFFFKNIFYLLVIFGLTGPLISLKSESISEINNKPTNDKLSTDYFKKNKFYNYILGAGDTLGIIISRDYPELTTEVTIDVSGNISLQKIKNIYVEGLTLKELTFLLNEAYGEFILYPDAEIIITSYRKIKTFVRGEVENPGYQILEGALVAKYEQNGKKNVDNIYSENNSFPNIENTKVNFFPTIFDAIRSAGGITRFSDLSKVNVYRINSISNGGGLLKTTLNFKRTINDGNISQNIRIYDGDIIEIPKLDKPNDDILSQAINSRLNKKFIDVFISGRIKNRDGRLKISSASSLNDAIYARGGLKLIKGKINFIRFNNDGSVMKRNFKYSKKARRGSYANPFLMDGDIIYVGDNIFNNATEIITEITSPFSSAFSSYGLFKIISN